ncbi:unnamed protein product [Symbiodinium sp. CCMP2592]|nr:unnamed protein product [Symbiodinium sp. CCMP2592]
MPNLWQRLTRKSTSGSTVNVLGCNVVSAARTQGTLALSSGEAELCAIGQGVSEALFVRSMLLESNLAKKEIAAEQLVIDVAALSDLTEDDVRQTGVQSNLVALHLCGNVPGHRQDLQRLAQGLTVVRPTADPLAENASATGPAAIDAALGINVRLSRNGPMSVEVSAALTAMDCGIELTRVWNRYITTIVENGRERVVERANDIADRTLRAQVNLGETLF